MQIEDELLANQIHNCVENNVPSTSPVNSCNLQEEIRKDQAGQSDGVRSIASWIGY